MRSKIRATGRAQVAIVAVATAILLAMTGCGKEDEQAASTTEWEEVDDESSADAGTMETGSDFASVVDDSDEEPEPIEVQIGRLIVDVPGYYVAEENNTADAASYEYLTVNDIGAVVFIYTEEVNIDETKFRNGKEILGERVVDRFNFDETTLVNSQTSEYMGMPGFSYDYEIE